MEVVNKTWYKDLEEPDMFYMNFTSLKLFDQLSEFFSGLPTVDAVNIPQPMRTLFANANGIPQFINMMEATQRNSKRTKL